MLQTPLQDIVGVPGVEAEAELLAAITTFFTRVGLGPADVGLKVSSRKVGEHMLLHAAWASMCTQSHSPLTLSPTSPLQVLSAVLERYGVSSAQFGPVCVVVDKMEKLPREQVGG